MDAVETYARLVKEAIFMEYKHRIFWLLPGGFFILLGMYAGICWLILNILITPERMTPAKKPMELGFHDAKELSFISTMDGVTLKAWFVPAMGERVIILIHGIHNNAWGCQTPDYVHAYKEAGFDVFLFDLRGHGQSGGDHFGLGILEQNDVRDIVELLIEQGFKPGHIGIHGTSYGASIALLASAQIDEIAAVIADSAFSNIRDVIGGELERQTDLPSAFAEILLPGLRLLGLMIYSLDIDESAPENVIGRISPRPILLIHGTEDTIIPYEHAKILKAAAGKSTKLWAIPGDHTPGVRLDCEKISPMRADYLEKVTDFFKRYLKGS